MAQQKSIVLFLLIFLMSFSVKAQQIKTVRDAGLWLGVGLEYKIHENHRLSIFEETRLNQTVTRFDEQILDIGYDFKISKLFKLGANCRYISNKEKDFSLAHDFRYNIDLSFGIKFKENFKLKYRLRFQQYYEDFWDPSFDEFERTSNLRNKIQLDYRHFKKHTLYISSEFFRKYVDYRKPFFNKARFAFGDKIDTKMGEIALTLLYEREFGDSNPLRFVVVRANYTFQFKKKND